MKYKVKRSARLMVSVGSQLKGWEKIVLKVYYLTVAQCDQGRWYMLASLYVDSKSNKSKMSISCKLLTFD